MAPATNETFSPTEGGQNCDMILVLSSELVCQLAEQYFNKTMLKQKVSVIELQARPDGLIQFMLSFKHNEVTNMMKAVLDDLPLEHGPSTFVPVPRAVNGRFRRKHAQEE